jgi:inorganic pyrophosphatase
VGKKLSKHASNLIRLEPLADGKLLRVVIETPKGSRNKYAFDHALGAFRLSRVLPAGMSFPFDFGFIPQTKAGDGDPVDVLVLMDEPAFPGCVVECRLIGVVKGVQEEHGETRANPRLIAVANEHTSFSKIKRFDDLPKQLRRDITSFFENYHAVQGRRFRVLATAGPKKARKLLDSGRRAA